MFLVAGSPERTAATLYNSRQYNKSSATAGIADRGVAKAENV